MIQFDDTKEREQRADLCYADGLLDIGIGVGLFSLGIVTLVGLGALAGVYLALLFPIVKSAKRSVTMPRMHHLDFMPEPDAEWRIRRVKGVVTASMVVLIAIGALAFFMSRMIPPPLSTWLREHAIILFGALLAAFFVLLGWGTATARLRHYAVITAVALVFCHWFDLGASFFLLLIGIVTIVWGSNVLSRFVRSYPRMHERNGKAYQRTI